jgi:hypothetical protein
LALTQPLRSASTLGTKAGSESQPHHVQSTITD